MLWDDDDLCLDDLFETAVEAAVDFFMDPGVDTLVGGFEEVEQAAECGSDDEDDD